MCKFKFVFISWKSSCCFLAAASLGHGWSHTGLGFFRSRTDRKDDCEEKRGDVIAQSWTQGVRAECLSELLLVLTSTWSCYPHRQRLAASHGQCQIMASVKPEKALEVAADGCPWCVIVDRREPGRQNTGSHEREALDVDSDPPNSRKHLIVWESVVWERENDTSQPTLQSPALDGQCGSRAIRSAETQDEMEEIGQGYIAVSVFYISPQWIKIWRDLLGDSVM